MGLFLVFLLFLSRATARGDFEAHAARVRDFSCGMPQPRAVNLREIVNDEREWLEKYERYLGDIHPPGTILWRCENSGCCRHGHECRVQDLDLVELPFLNATGPVHPFGITAGNHTRCSCQKIGANRIK